MSDNIRSTEKRIRKYLDTCPRKRRLVNVSALAFRCSGCWDIFLDGEGSLTESGKKRYCDDCAFVCPGCEKWIIKEHIDDCPFFECETCGEFKCYSCMTADEYGTCVKCRNERQDNWEQLKKQPCGGGDECNCFLGNDWFGYDINTMYDNEDNWQNLCRWMRQRNAPQQLTVALLKQYARQFKEAGLLVSPSAAPAASP